MLTKTMSREKVQRLVNHLQPDYLQAVYIFVTMIQAMTPLNWSVFFEWKLFIIYLKHAA